MTRNAHTPNWLLRGLVLLSIAIHLALVLHLSGVYRSRAMSVIEFSLKNDRVSSQRNIPRPRFRPKNLPRPVTEPKVVTAARVPPSMKPLKMDSYKADVPDIRGASAGQQLNASISQQAIPGNNIESWQPVAVPGVSGDGYESAESYLEMIRFRIEKHKLYPATARNQGLKGRVILSLVISLQGEVHSISIKKSSGYDVLDNAALSAIRRAVPFPSPPGKFFKKDISLTIPILFEII